MIDYLLKGVLIGLLFGIPVGVIGTMTVQRTWSFGVKAGLLTGLGSSIADCVYAIIGAFGLTLISDFLLRYQLVIHLLGGGLILYMGISLICKKKKVSISEVLILNDFRIFTTSFAVGITNPAAILTFLFAFSYFGISGVIKPVHSIGLVVGVFIGTYLWWSILSFGTDLINKKTKSSNFHYSNQVFGTILTLFGMVIVVGTFF